MEILDGALTEVLSPLGARWCSAVPGPGRLLGPGADPLLGYRDQKCQLQRRGTLHPQKPRIPGGVCDPDGSDRWVHIVYIGTSAAAPRPHLLMLC